MRALGILLMTCALVATVFAQPEEEILWTRTYGGAQHDHTRSVVYLPDGGFAFCGQTCSTDNGSCDLWGVRTNAEGDIIWSHLFGGIQDEDGWSIDRTMDGGFILAGETQSTGAGGYDFFVVRVNAAGEPLWTRTYGGAYHDGATSVAACSDGGFIIAGRTNSFGNGSQDIYLIKTDGEGNPQWSRTYGGTNFETASRVLISPDGGFVVSGLTESFGNGYWDAYLFKVNSQGDLVWSRTYGGTDKDYIQSFSLTEDQGYLLAAVTFSNSYGWGDGWLIKTNSEGLVDWEHRYGDSSPNSFNAAVQAPDGGYFGVGETDYHPYRGWVVRTDPQGNVLWSQVLDGWDEDWLLDCNTVPSGGFIVAGHRGQGVGGSDDAWLIRYGSETDSLGTDVAGTVSGVWDMAGSPYRVLGDITVPTGHTLAIAPGVHVLFTGHYKFNIYGTVIAEGTEQDSIVFTRAHPTEESKWWGLRIIEASANTRFGYCVIEYGKATGSDVDCVGGGIMTLLTSPTFHHCTIRNNWAQYAGGGIGCYDGIARFDHCVITGNTSAYGYGGGVNCWHSQAVFTNCTISDNIGSVAGGALRIGQSSSLFENTIFAFSGSGSGVTFAAGTPYGAFHSCNFYGNGGGNLSGAIPAGMGVITQTNGNGDPCDQFFNIFLDPAFAERMAGDYHLTPHSPCINAGNPGSPHDPDESVSDIGAFYFDLRPHHHFLPVPPTGLPYVIVVDGATVDGEALRPGDEIGVFDGLLCVGAAPVGGEWPLTVTAWAADVIHDLPGFMFGNPITYRVWSREDDFDIPATANYTVGNGEFGNGVYSRVSLEASAQWEQLVTLHPNYANLISLCLRPPHPDIAELFGDCSSLIGIYEDNGRVYIPPDVNTIGEMHLIEGYRVFCSEPEELYVMGPPINPQQEFPLRAGAWNWIGYPLTDCVPVEDALISIAPHVIVIQDDAGGAWIPAEGINTLGDLVPGKGYMILVDQDVVLRYGAPVLQTQRNAREIAETPQDFPQPTGLPYNVVVKLENWSDNERPSRIDLYDGERGVGTALVSDGQEVIPVVAWQEIPDLGLEGFTPGHAINVVARDQAGRVLPCRVRADNLLYGSSGYGTLLLTADGSSAETPASFSVGEGYPNPFNPVTTIPYVLPEAGVVGIHVFNALGQSLWESVESQTAGEHRFVFDASQFSDSPVSGLYFVRVEYAGRAQIRKLVLLR